MDKSKCSIRSAVHYKKELAILHFDSAILFFSFPYFMSIIYTSNARAVPRRNNLRHNLDVASREKGLAKVCHGNV